MKIKTLLFPIALLFIHHSVLAQIAFYDAQELRKYVVSQKFGDANKSKVDSILAKYLPNEDETINSTFGTNPFIKAFFPDVAIRSGFAAIKSQVSSLGSLNVTNLADGIARFLIKRGKEELNVAFFNRFKNFLEKNIECKTLFPVTTEFLGEIATYRYAELIQSLREVFYKDLSNLIISLNQLIDHPKYKELLKNLPEIGAAVRCSKIVSELSQSEKSILPDSLIHQLAELPELQEISSNLGNSLKLLDIFSQAIREKPDSIVVSDSPQRRWIKLSDLNNLVNDQVTLRIFMGLIYQKVNAADIQFTIPDTSFRVTTFMSQNVQTIHVISGLIENFAILANDVDRNIKDLRDKLAKGTLSNDDYYTYISKAINITEYGFKVANTINEGVANDNYIIMARNANNLYKNIYTKNYNNAVMNVYTILNQAFNNRNKLVDQKITSTTLNDSLKAIEIPKSEIIEKILKYGNFMASVVKAESGEDVQNALEAAALPAGSFSIKQKSAFNISLNGYIGYALDYREKDLYARGVYAPVGISASWGSRYRRPTLTGFVSLIDVGGIATYRLENGTTETLKQEVRLESIFSPSIQVFVEPIPGFPFAIGAGYRKTPKLFYSDNTSFTVVPSQDVFNISFLIDIPIFNIVNNQHVKK